MTGHRVMRGTRAWTLDAHHTLFVAYYFGRIHHFLTTRPHRSTVVTLDVSRDLARRLISVAP